MSGVFEIDWCDVASKTLDHADRGVDRRRGSLPTRRDAHGALRVAPAGSAEAIMIAIPDGVQACAGADFEKPERETRILGDLEKPPTSTPDRPTSFVCGGDERKARMAL